MQKKRFKIIIAVMMVLVFVGAAAGCAAPVVTKPQMTANATPVKVDGSCQIELNGDTLTVKGETNILDGAMLHISVVSQDGMIVDFVKMTKQGDSISQDFKITSEKYDDTVKSVTGYISCAPTLYGTQPDAIYSAYGQKFENVEAPEGDIVWNSNGVVIVFGSDSVEINK